MKVIPSILLIFTCACSMAQVNLVINPSLEEYTQCPRMVDEVGFAKGWKSLDTSWYPDPPFFVGDAPGMPDYCNVCAEDSSFDCGVPMNTHFYHYPRTGAGMAQVQMFDNEVFPGNIQLRDYLQGHLSASLIAGQPYCITFYILQERGSYYHINHIGAYLDNGIIDTTVNYGLIQTEYTPQIVDNAIISDTINWTKVQGSFVANGTERLITIGNFTDIAHTDFVPVWDTSLHGCICTSGLGASWYLVDDVSVIRSDATASAGPDKIIAAAGDTVLIGDTLDSYVPTYWYKNGVLIDSNKSGIFVHPDTTAMYVVGLQLCGGVSYDTVMVRLASDTAHTDTAITDTTTYVRMLNCASVQIYPNPAGNTITIAQAKGGRLIISNVMGQQVFNTTIQSNKEIENIQQLPAGVYVLQVIDPGTGFKVTRKVLKE